MPLIKIVKPFKFAHGGHTVEAFEPGPEPVDTSDECAAIAVAEGWAKKVKQRSAPDADAAAAEALRVRIAELQDLHGKATDDATKAALAAELAAKQAELAELG